MHILTLNVYFSHCRIRPKASFQSRTRVRWCR